MTLAPRSVRAALAAAFALAVLLAPTASAEVFKARMLTGMAPVEPPMVNVQMEITSWTTLDEIRQFQDVLGSAGIDAFLAAFDKADKGIVRFMTTRGWNLPIHAAVVVPELRRAGLHGPPSIAGYGEPRTGGCSSVILGLILVLDQL